MPRGSGLEGVAALYCDCVCVGGGGRGEWRKLLGPAETRAFPALSLPLFISRCPPPSLPGLPPPEEKPAALVLLNKRLPGWEPQSPCPSPVVGLWGPAGPGNKRLE